MRGVRGIRQAGALPRFRSALLWLLLASLFSGPVALPVDLRISPVIDGSLDLNRLLLPVPLALCPLGMGPSHLIQDVVWLPARTVQYVGVLTRFLSGVE